MLLPTQPAVAKYRLVSGNNPVPSGPLANIAFSGTTDDSSLNINLQYPLMVGGVAYTYVGISSNAYISFGGGSSAYSSLGPSNPALNTIHYGSGDRSYQRVSYQYDTTAKTTKIFYEGTSSTSGNISTANLKVCITIYQNNFVQLDFGAANVDMRGGLYGFSNGSTWRIGNYNNGRNPAGISYTFFSTDAQGNCWNVRESMIVNEL